MKIQNINNWIKKFLLLPVVGYLLVIQVLAQTAEKEKSLIVTAVQFIHFGTFYLVGFSGGTITVGYDGTRTSTGGVILLANAPIAQPAIFEIKSCEGHNIILSFNPKTTLTSSNGGKLTLDIGPTNRGINGSGFSIKSDCKFVFPLRVGGTLHIPGTAPPGVYRGNFDFTCKQE
ncbi:MAG: DUF4402 domain-containing protein [Mariniphaga sp.]